MRRHVAVLLAVCGGMAAAHAPFLRGCDSRGVVTSKNVGLAYEECRAGGLCTAVGELGRCVGQLLAVCERLGVGGQYAAVVVW